MWPFKRVRKESLFQLNFLQVVELDRQMFLCRTPVGRGLQKRRAEVRGLFYSRAVCNWVSKIIWKCIRFAYLALWFDEENWRSTNQIRNWKPSLIAHSPKLFLIRFFRNVHLVKRLCMKLWVLMLTERSCFTCKAHNYELLAVVSDLKWYNCKYTHAFVLERMRNSSTVWGCYTASLCICLQSTREAEALSLFRTHTLNALQCCRPDFVLKNHRQ